MNLINACLGGGHMVPHQGDTTVVRFLRRVFISRCWAAAGGPMGCLGVDDVCEATIEEMSQAVFLRVRWERSEVISFQ
jgi:hypothetical protein